MEIYQQPVCKICGKYLVTHDDHSGQYCPVCIWDAEHYQEGVPYPDNNNNK